MNETKTIIISQKDYDEYQSLKQIIDEESGIAEFSKNKEAEILNELDNQKRSMLEKLDQEFIGKRKGLEEDLKKEFSELMDSITKTKTEKETLVIEVEKLKKSNEDIKVEKQRILDGANDQANKILEKAEQESMKVNVDYKKKLTQKDAELEKRNNILEEKEIEFEAKDKILKRREASLIKKEEIYMEASPDTVKSLELELEQKKAFIDKLRADYLELQESINQTETLKLKANGRSLEELLKESEQLLNQISSMEDKCNRFTEFELSQMSRAYNEEPILHREIELLTRDLRDKTSELTRLKNNVTELEQLKAQMDLIRTLNDHLRQELETSKRALESRVGEVCPALKEIDIEESDENGNAQANYNKRKQLTANGKYRSKTLFDIAQHVKNFAASQNPPLFYNDKDIRAFIAGLAASKLTILQGLSGTGKTSLPKVFMDALFGEKKVVAVESSWRDRNELLGYYNDFNRKFTAKEFTCNLYKAGMPNYSDTPFFIILDEMNLSRVEYYFADFLSVLEDNKSNWEIKLVDVDLRSLPSELPNEVIEFIEQDGNQRIKELTEKLYISDNKLEEDIIDQTEKLELINYLSKYSLKKNELHHKLLGGPQKLISGNTIRIPENVWFIGTANRDESTFEISDKVYDRAQVLNFDKLAIGNAGVTTDILYIPYKMLKKLFDDAIQANTFKAQDDPLIEKIDKHLREKFKISFGNRITMQMDKFVPVYIAAGQAMGVNEDDLRREAIDYQLTNKVLRKLEYKQTSKENLDELKKLFEDELLVMGTEFIEWKKQNEG